jgi:hypothetical protein
VRIIVQNKKGTLPVKQERETVQTLNMIIVVTCKLAANSPYIYLRNIWTCKVRHVPWHNKGKDKVKFNLEQATKVQRGSIGYSSTLSLTLALDRGWVFNAMPRPL